MQTRSRPNSWANRYNQWVTAGRIAYATGATVNGRNVRDTVDSGNLGTVWSTNNGEPHWSVIGQEYLHQLGLQAIDLPKRGVA